VKPDEAGNDVPRETELPDKDALRRIHKRLATLVDEEA